MSLSETELVYTRQMQDTKQDKRNPTLPTNLLSSFGWAYQIILTICSLTVPVNVGSLIECPLSPNKDNRLSLFSAQV